ncbi:uncharacterized protein CPUR_06739 [Claviceps purpurea 20.1]|uniref:GAG-pre-integrase domain-containing protein n=1 Tax=Claviceps purpurea (strain 20.1) TaxID=1111077 RepID=M1WHK2_CLAP2|nr:uncharacterized protein CPUR_06739 [Claviceps purpurea 20.1]
MVLTAETATQYKELLNDARWANTSPDTWMEKWNTVYQKAVRQNINKIKGINAIQDFIQAVGTQFEPTWAEAKKVKLVEYNNNLPDTVTLKSVAEEFMRYRKATRIFDHNNCQWQGYTRNFGQPFQQAQQRNSNQGYSEEYQLPLWRTPTKDLCEKIKQRYESPKWETLRTIISNEGWDKPDTKPKEQFPGRVSAAIIDPNMVEPYIQPRVAFTTTASHHHMLAKSALFDNCGAMHVVNDSRLFEDGSIRFSADGEDYLEAGTTSFQICGRGTRVIKNILNGHNGPCTEDLVLHDVAFVPGFLVNIVSESKLIEKQIWYCGADSTLRYGSLQNNVVSAQLIRRFNITFLEYNLVSTCHSSDPSSVNMINAISQPAYTRDRIQPRHARHPRTDTENLWHLRSGHLGQEALRRLVLHAKGVNVTPP